MSKVKSHQTTDNTSKDSNAKEVVKPLTKAEKSALEKYEKEVDEHKASFIAMAVALTLIQKKELYRGQGTFAEYCEARFDIKRAYAYKLIAAGKIQDELKELGAPEVSNESQARLLGTIKTKDERAEVMEKAQELAGDGKDILAQHISAAIGEVRPELKAKGRNNDAPKKVGSTEVEKWLKTITALHKHLVDDYEDSDNEIATLAGLKAEIEAALGMESQADTVIDIESLRSDSDPDTEGDGNTHDGDSKENEQGGEAA